MAENEDEEDLLRSVALQNARSILLARRRAEDALRKQSEWLRITLASIGDAVISTDAEGRVTFLNGVAEAMTGWNQAEANGRPLDEVFRIVNERTRQVVENPVEKVFRHGHVVGLANHTILIAKDGTERPIDDSAAPIKDDRGEITGVVLVFHDVTEKRKAENALAESLEFNRRIIDSSPDCLKVMDLDGRLQSMNDYGCRLMEVDDFALCLNREWVEFWPVDARDLPGEALERARGGQIASFQGFCPTAKGTGKWWDVTVSPIFDTEGRPSRLLAVSRDITQRKRAEDAREQRARQLQKLADISARINAAHDVQSVVGVVTEEARNLIGARQSATSMVLTAHHPQPINVISTASNRPSEAASPKVDGVELYEAVNEENRPIRLTQDELGHDRRWRTLEKVALAIPTANGWLAAPLVGRNGKSMGLLQLADKDEGEFTAEDEAILVQLSRLAAIAIENAKLYDELRGNDQRKDEFLAMLAHELRNPLAAIGNAVSVTTRSGQKEHIDWSMDVITRQMKHLTRLIDDLLDVSRISRGKIELRKDVIDATPILDSSAATVMPLVEERKHTLDVAIDRGNLWVNVDPTRLEQVVVNLLNNAAKYSENAGHINLVARNDGKDVVITVRDKGVGIPPEKLPGMFELFAQGDRSLARSEGGLGIGLTVVKKLVEMHGGSITAISEGAGHGSEFTIRLPAAKRPAVARAKVAGSEVGAGKKARILVVDDNTDTARGMARLLKLIGHDVATAHDGHEALDAARRHEPEFILLDIGLPGMDGYEVVSRLRREECCKDAVIVAVSGYGQDEDRRRSKEAGFDFHLIKPLDHDALLSLLSTRGNGRA